MSPFFPYIHWPNLPKVWKKVWNGFFWFFPCTYAAFHRWTFLQPLWLQTKIVIFICQDRAIIMFKNLWVVESKLLTMEMSISKNIPWCIAQCLFWAKALSSDTTCTTHHIASTSSTEIQRIENPQQPSLCSGEDECRSRYPQSDVYTPAQHLLP